MNPRSTDCEADAQTTTPSRRFKHERVGRVQKKVIRSGSKEGRRFEDEGGESAALA